MGKQTMGKKNYLNGGATAQKRLVECPNRRLFDAKAPNNIYKSICALNGAA